MRIAGRLQVVADVVIAAAGVASTLPAALGDGPHVDTDERLAVPGCRRCLGVRRSRPAIRIRGTARITVPHWDNARAGGGTSPRPILGLDVRRSSAEPYWFSDIGAVADPAARLASRRPANGAAGTACTPDSTAPARPCCVLLMNAATQACRCQAAAGAA